MKRRTALQRRGNKRKIELRSRLVRYRGNGFRSVSLAETLASIEKFFLSSETEVQYEMRHRPGEDIQKAVLHYLAPEGKDRDKHHFGKGLDSGQTLASACFEFFERLCAGQRADDNLITAEYEAVSTHALDPREFCLSRESPLTPTLPIDWIWGYSLTRSENVLVPANLAFCPYEPSDEGRYISWVDSNGLASGNNLEEAILHAILEVVERDALIISEYNRLSLKDISSSSFPPSAGLLLERLTGEGFECLFKWAMTDIPIPVVAAFIRQRSNPLCCSMAFGCHLDPSLALSRSLTEAVQLLPPTVNHQEWLDSGSPARFTEPGTGTAGLDDFPNPASDDLRENIRTCVEILSSFEIEVIIVDLSLSGIPFPAVRVLATGLQPICRKEDMRLSERFFRVPLTLGHRDRRRDRGDIEVWPICGFR